MPLAFHPDPGTIVICDFSTGFRAPEMVKVRPVVIISPRRRSGQHLVTVVPLSSTAPRSVERWHHQLSPGAYPPARGIVWAKCDMVETVALARLDRVKAKINGQRTYQTFNLPPADLAAIQTCVKIALGLA